MLTKWLRKKPHTTTRRKRPTPEKDPVTARQVIPGLRIQGKLGAGGFATVFRAQHVQSRTTVALKVLSPRAALDPRAVERFLSEARLICQFEHPNLVRGFGFGKSKGLIHLIMEYVEGDSVLDLLDQWKGALAPRIALDITRQVAEALDYLQQRGFVHRDIKPSNLLYTPRGRVKVCDLGLAESAGIGSESGAAAELTSGTPGYMAPEQARGSAGLDARADIYSLGATLYHMITGEAPAHDPGNPERRKRHVLDGVERAQRCGTGIDRTVISFLLRMMEEDPARRFPTPKELAREISDHLDGLRPAR